MSRIPDFSGYATKNGVRCRDGRTIMKDAFASDDGKRVPLVYQHQHNSIDNVLGHCILHNQADGVIADAFLNNTKQGQTAKEIIKSGDLTALSIFANDLVQKGGDVVHGVIREVSLVLAGANPEAFIDEYSIQHSGIELGEEAVISMGAMSGIEIYEDDRDDYDDYMAHADEEEPDDEEESDDEGETVKDVFDTLSAKQKKAVYIIVDAAVQETKDSMNKGSSKPEPNDNEGGNTMKHNAFSDGNRQSPRETVDFSVVMSDARRVGSLKGAFAEHGVKFSEIITDQITSGDALAHGITNLGYMFPDAKAISNQPDLISRDMAWVSNFMGKAKKTPFARIKMLHANITADEARARGYIKGKQKQEETFALLKRTVDPQTVYKLQKFDRDDLIDVTDWNVLSFVQSEMRIMLNEEIARAGLVGDGRSTASDDKIQENHIIPVWTDDDLYTIHSVVSVATSDDENTIAKNFIKTVLRSRKSYKGSGNPILFTTEDILTDMLLIEDTTGRAIYDSIDKLKAKLRVSDIVTVPVMEGCTRTVVNGDKSETRTLMALILNPIDYTYGADKGGSVTMFDEFDIDYNKQAYLLETRCSGCLTKPYSAISVESVPATT